MKNSVLILHETPPSFNAVGLRSHWTVGRRHKRHWQEQVEMGLLTLSIPRPCTLIEVRARLTFDTHRRRDEGNYRVILEKATGDALVNGNWIIDDTPEHFRFFEVDFNPDLGPARTALRFKWKVI